MTKMDKLASGAAAFLFLAYILGSQNNSPDLESKSFPEKPHKKNKTVKRDPGECRSMAGVTYKVIRKVDKTHYRLESSDGGNGSGGILMETHRELSGDGIQFDEGTYLGISGPRIVKSEKDWSKTIFKWREGCSKKAKDEADITKGTWWISVAPNGVPCSKAVTESYNVAPATLMSASPECVVSSNGGPMSLLFLDCTKSALGFKLVYSRSRDVCLKFVGLVKTFNQWEQQHTGE